VRLVAIEMVHGAAGSTAFGVQEHLWAPAATGAAFDLSPTSLRALAPFRDALTIVSNTDCANAEAFEASEIGGDHFRSSAVFLTQAHPRRTEGADVEAGTSLDQLYAARAGDAPVPSLQLCIEPIDQAGGCGYGYSCVYTDSISWASPTRPLPMVRDPRVAFDLLFGAFGQGRTPEERRESRAIDRSILDMILASAQSLRARLGAADRARLNEYLDHVREIERRLQAVEARNVSGETRALPAAPAGVPDAFDEHVRLMFDLQLLAFESDLTRVVSFKLGRDNSNRVYQGSGSDAPFHPASHHGGREEKIREFEKINAYHVGQLAYLLERLRDTLDADGTSLLHNSVVLYGSSMGDSNQHNHRKVPFFLAGHAGGRLHGGTHIRARAGTPLANAMLSLLRVLGLEEMNQFGDSDNVIDLNAFTSRSAAAP
jgi:hypothetical protein